MQGGEDVVAHGGWREPAMQDFPGANQWMTPRTPLTSRPYVFLTTPDDDDDHDDCHHELLLSLLIQRHDACVR